MQISASISKFSIQIRGDVTRLAEVYLHVKEFDAAVRYPQVNLNVRMYLVSQIMEGS